MIKGHYQKDYFDWQKEAGALSTKLTIFMFAPHIHTDDNLLEFGCGGGFY